jgi:hypothetical protein
MFLVLVLIFDITIWDICLVLMDLSLSLVNIISLSYTHFTINSIPNPGVTMLFV